LIGFRVIEHIYSKSPPKTNSKYTKRNNSPPSPLNNSFDSDAERLLEMQEKEK